MKNKTKKSPTGAPLGNPLKYFREGGEKRMAAYKKGGYNVPKNSLPRRDNGGPGSGMGRMAADDAAFDAMMAQPSPRTSPYPSEENARTLAALASEAANKSMQSNNSQNVNIANAALLTNRGSQPPIVTKAPGVREERGFQPKLGSQKKGGSVRRKK